jgi:hypothetical protein
MPIPKNEKDDCFEKLLLKSLQEVYRSIITNATDEWEDWDNRIACPHFDVCEAGCLYCDRYDMVMDTQSLTCPLELDLNRRKEKTE